MRNSFSFFRGGRAHTKESEIFSHNISAQARIKQSEIFNLQYFKSRRTYCIHNSLNAHHRTRHLLFPHGSQWASERLVLTCAYLITGIQKVKRYIPHQLNAHDRSPKNLRQHCFQKTGIQLYPWDACNLLTSGWLVLFIHSHALVESTIQRALRTHVSRWT